MGTTTPLAIFRCDGGPNVGAGHIMRCQALASRLADHGWQTQFAVTEASAQSMKTLMGKSDILNLGGLPDTPEKIESLIDRQCDLLVIDHYGLAAPYERKCRDWAKRLLVFDDLANRDHDCDVLTDFTPGRSPNAYSGKVPTQCETLTGPLYAPLRRTFSQTRLLQTPQRQSKARPEILISLGATDPTNLTCEILDRLHESEIDINLTVALSATAPHLAEVKEKLTHVGGRLLVDSNDMAAVLSGADLVIGAGGISAWERCCLGKPTVLAVTADNQRANAEALSEMGAVLLLGETDRIASAIFTLINNAEQRDGLARRSAELCDGLGAARLLLSATASPTAKDGTPITLRPATADDAKVMLDWQCHEATRRYARNPEIPTGPNHIAWLHAKLADPNCVFNIVTYSGKPAGVLRFDFHAQRNGFEVSIITAPDLYGLGIAGKTLSLGRALIDDWDLYAFIDPKNRPSQKLFESAGYIETAEHGWFVSQAPVTGPATSMVN